jgi:intraflagellar transport protein 172
LHQYEEAIALAKSRHMPQSELESMTTRCFQLLLGTNQNERAAALKEREGDFEFAVKLYLKGGLPAQAIRVLSLPSAKHAVSNYTQWLDTLSTALSAAGMHDKAGEAYEEQGQLQRALDAYVKGCAWRKAVELARR